MGNYKTVKRHNNLLSGKIELQKNFCNKKDNSYHKQRFSMVRKTSETIIIKGFNN